MTRTKTTVTRAILTTVAALLTPSGVWAQAPPAGAAAGTSPQVTPTAGPAEPLRLPGQPPVGGPLYRNLRDEEDWSFLRAARRAGLPTRDPWDALKFVPLDADGGRYLSLGGEIRPRWERLANAAWGEDVPDESGYLLQRYMLHADARLGRFTRSGATWRVFGQLKSGAISGNAAPPGPPDRDDLDLNQLFVDLALPVGPAADRPGAGRLPGPDSLTVRLGRQEMNYGSGRLISVREGPNVRFGFDAARLILRRGGTRVDLFAARPVGTSPGRFDDRTIPGRDLAGVYATLPSPGLGGSADAYYLYARRADIAFSGPGRGGERRHSVGGRLFGSARGWDWNAEAVGQWGEFDAAGAGGAGERRGHDIRAWTLATDTGYTWAGRRGRPRLALKVDYASGDSDPDDGTVGTFNPLYPRGNYFGELGVLGPLNLTDVHPTLDFEAARGVAVTLDWDLFWRASAGDGVYGFAGNLLRPSGGSRARWVGHSPSVAVSWQAERHTNVFASWGYFAPGRFLRETGTARPISYGTLYVTYKF